MPDSFTEAAAAANPPVAAQATPTPVPSIYNGLRVLAATADQVAGLGVKPITQQLTDLAHSVVSDVTDHKKQGDMLMGIAGTGEFGEGEGSELEGEAKKLYDGLRVRKADEVMVQPEVTSRATPTGEGASLPAEIHANLEKQAGRKLSDDEAVALDRANLERGMVSAPEGNTNHVREAKRSQLEKPRSDSEHTPEGLAKSAGLKYKGELTKDSDVHQFEHPDHPGKTIAVKGKDLTTPEALKTRMTQKLADFEAGKKLGSK